ncbi:hypothetical protein DFH11DRAFT_1509678 [Phellopilus nigrolimitatus]|nr:hypothetical protein DFH11DRAFT_1509678 [Phellopilus nigrolimitatus]
MHFAENAKCPKSSVFKWVNSSYEDERGSNSALLRTNELTLTIKSPSVRVLRRPDGKDISLPVFGDHDHVKGIVALDPQNCAAECGRLTITIEGIFEYVSPMSATKAGPAQITPGKHRHVFYQDSVVIPLSTASSSEPSKRPRLRSAMNTIRRMSDTLHSSPPGSPKMFNFGFELPKALNASDELPSSFSSSNVVSSGVRGRVYSENADVRYKIRTLWEALDGSGSQAQLETPVLFQSDTDFLSFDGLNSESWSEVPLGSISKMPVDCAVTIPDPTTFSRKSSIPYFVVFTTKPRSRVLAAEIMADATIAVSLVRRVGFDKPDRNLPTTISRHGPDSQQTRSASSFSPISPLVNGQRARLLKRVAKSAPPILSAFRFSRADPDQDRDGESSPSEPPTRLTDSRTLHTDVSVGFPKRPKGREPQPGSHPSLETVGALPDGLYKGQIPLQRDWFPSVKWKTLSIEYFLHISVIYDNAEFKGQVPLRLY